MFSALSGPLGCFSSARPDYHRNSCRNVPLERYEREERGRAPGSSPRGCFHDPPIRPKSKCWPFNSARDKGREEEAEEEKEDKDQEKEGGRRSRQDRSNFNDDTRSCAPRGLSTNATMRQSTRAEGTVGGGEERSAAVVSACKPHGAVRPTQKAWRRPRRRGETMASPRRAL